MATAGAVESTSQTSTAIESFVPNSSVTLLFVEMGVGYDEHVQDVTKASMKVCRDAISSNSIPAFRRGFIHKMYDMHSKSKETFGNHDDLATCVEYSNETD
ncbi:hypothetical protein L2E82_32073 [Cichorium intybus]|uniref:Uncharacterized protein n=1 Tax=Cichorium intybus TaxID=13427 RepID=A0ACB9BFE5_CICIN|nr:hypothetical protein L2E82_32073 [Cichorium intybus]